MNWGLLTTSLGVAGAAAAGAVGLGSVVGIWMTGLSARARGWAIGLCLVALMWPPFQVADAWIYGFGTQGRWAGWLPFNLFSPAGTVFLLVLLYWPLTALLACGAWQRLESGHLESEPGLSGIGVLRWLLWPQARPAIVLGAVVSFVLALNQFTIPAILQTRVYPVEFWIQFSTTMNYAQAWKQSWPLALAPVAVLAVLARRPVAWPRRSSALDAAVFRRHLGCRWHAAAAGLSGVVLAVSLAPPLVSMAGSGAVWAAMPGVLRTVPEAALRSAVFAAATATVAIGLGYGLWRSRWAYALWLPFFLPGVWIGLGLAAGLNRPGTGAIYDSVAIVVMALVIRYAVLGWHAMSAARASADPAWEDAARLEGASGLHLFRCVRWPQIRSSAAAAWYVIYLLCLWDVDTILLISPPQGETVALRIFHLLHYGHNAQVGALCIVLLGLALAPMAIWGVLLKIGPAGRRLAGAMRGSGAAGWWLVALGVSAGIGGGCGREGSGTPGRIESRLFDRIEVIGGPGSGAGQFVKPRSVAVDGRDELYVADMTGRIQRFDERGAFVGLWQIEPVDIGKPKGMERDPAGGIMVAEPHYGRISHFTPDGRLRSRWGRTADGKGALYFPRSMAVTGRGDIWVCEYGSGDRVAHVSAGGGQWLGSIGSSGDRAGELNRPEGIGVDSSGWVYVADSCNHRVQVFDPEGNWRRTLGRAGEGPGELSYPYDVRVDAAGYVFVCEFGNSRLQVFDSQGRWVEAIGGLGREPGRFFNPWGLALDSKGNLYVADAGNHRVQKLVRRS